MPINSLVVYSEWVNGIFRYWQFAFYMGYNSKISGLGG
jgi:hypothetical protein